MPGRVERARLRSAASRWWRYVAVAAGVFLAGVAVGWLVGATTDFSSLQGFQTAASPFPETLTFRTILQNNLLALGVTLLGVVTFGLVAVFSLFFNGFLVGVLVRVALPSAGALELVALLLPHGVLELPAFWLVGAVALRVVHRLVRYLRGLDDAALTRREAVEAGALVVAAAVLVVVAAWVEVAVTPAVADAV